MSDPRPSETPPPLPAPPAPGRPWAWWQIGLVLLLIALPLFVGWWYREVTALPARVTIATGPAGGRYREVAEELAAALRTELGIEVRTVPTTGSLENLRLLRSGEVDLAIVQADVGQAATLVRTADGSGSADVAFVANLYSEVVHVVVRRGVVVAAPEDLRGKSIAIGREDSGDSLTSRVLLEHLGLSIEDVDARAYDYDEISKAFEAGTLDVAIVTSSPDSPILRTLLAEGRCDLVDVPHAAALSRKRFAMSPFVVPAGLYRSLDPPEPRSDVSTVAVRAQMLCRGEAGNRFAGEIVRIVVGREFVKRNGLAELYFGGTDFARENPAFETHPGAEQFYDPNIDPLLDPDFVEATEGIRSFAVSLLIGLFLLYRWIRDRRTRRDEHALDRYIRALLDLERRHATLARETDESASDVAAQQLLLDELTRLRQEALRDFSAHELREDRATDTFLEMCHALSDKIGEQITRRRIESALRELRDAIVAAESQRPVGDVDQPSPVDASA